MNFINNKTIQMQVKIIYFTFEFHLIFLYLNLLDLFALDMYIFYTLFEQIDVSSFLFLILPSSHQQSTGRVCVDAVRMRTKKNDADVAEVTLNFNSLHFKHIFRMNAFILAVVCVCGFAAGSEDERLPNKCEGLTTKKTQESCLLQLFCSFRESVINIGLFVCLCQFVSFSQWSCRRLWRKLVTLKRFWRLERCWTQARGGGRFNTTHRKPDFS